MPKIRDLGINVIPYQLAPKDEEGAGDCTLRTCIDGSAHHCDSPSPAWEEKSPPQCGEKSNCPQNTKKHTSGEAGLSPAAIAQLRQQMRSELHP